MAQLLLSHVNGTSKGPICDSPYCSEEIDFNEPYILTQPQKGGRTFRFCCSGCFDEWWKGIN